MHVEARLSVANRGAGVASDFRVGLRRSEAEVGERLTAGDPASDFGVGLRRSEAVPSKLGAFQGAAAFCAAAIERHGDGGAQVLAGTSGLTRSDARGRVEFGHRPGRPASGTFREIPTFIENA